MDGFDKILILGIGSQEENPTPVESSGVQGLALVQFFLPAHPTTGSNHTHKIKKDLNTHKNYT